MFKFIIITLAVTYCLVAAIAAIISKRKIYFVMLKPDGFSHKQRGRALVLLSKEFNFVKTTGVCSLDEQAVREIYADKINESWFNELVTYITSGSVEGFLLKKKFSFFRPSTWAFSWLSGFKDLSAIIGATHDAEPGTVRWLFRGDGDKNHNGIHRCDKENLVMKQYISVWECLKN